MFRRMCKLRNNSNCDLTVYLSCILFPLFQLFLSMPPFPMSSLFPKFTRSHLFLFSTFPTIPIVPIYFVRIINFQVEDTVVCIFAVYSVYSGGQFPEVLDRNLTFTQCMGEITLDKFLPQNSIK